MDRMEYDVYRVTARWQGQEVVGMAAFDKGTDITTSYAKDCIKESVSPQARAKFGSDVDFEIVGVELGMAQFTLPENF